MISALGLVELAWTSECSMAYHSECGSSFSWLCFWRPGVLSSGFAGLTTAQADRSSWVEVPQILEMPVSDSTWVAETTRNHPSNLRLRRGLCHQNPRQGMCLSD
jgi:hypothetical protein